MWLIGGGDSAQKTSIEEANKHLSAMALKITELETALVEQAKELEYTNATFQQCIKESNEKNEQELSSLRSTIRDNCSTIYTLKNDLQRRDSELNILRQRCRMLDEIMRYKTSLAKLTITLEQAEQYSRAVSRTCTDPRISGNCFVNVHTDASPREVTLPIAYIVDEVPDEELADKASESLGCNGEAKKKVIKKVTLAEKASKSNEVLP